MTYTIYSFGTHINARPPREIEWVDCRCIDNPHRFRMGNDQKIERVRRHPLFLGLVHLLMGMVAEDGTAAVFCTWGRHRSVTVAEQAATNLRELGYTVEVIHLGRKR